MLRYKKSYMNRFKLKKTKRAVYYRPLYNDMAVSVIILTSTG